MKKKMETVEKKSTHKASLEGVVVNTKMMGTVKVAIETTVAHPKYKKSMKKVKTFLVHTDTELKEGTQVVIVQSRPYSKNVKWTVKSVK